MSQFFVAAQNGGMGAVTSVTGSNGVTASPSTGSVVVSGVNATTSSVGVASFNPNDFSVNAGQVSLLSSVIGQWTDEAANFPASGGNGYFIIADAVTATLPTFAPSTGQGTTIEFIVDYSPTSGFTIQAPVGAMIRIAGITSSTNRTFKATVQGNSVELIYRQADQVWIAGDNNGSWIPG